MVGLIENIAISASNKVEVEVEAELGNKRRLEFSENQGTLLIVLIKKKSVLYPILTPYHSMSYLHIFSDFGRNDDYEEQLSLVPNTRGRKGSFQQSAFPEHHRKVSIKGALKIYVSHFWPPQTPRCDPK